MLGLIQKDMYCLKKNLMLFCAITGGVILLSVMFILSSQFGNVAKGIESMMIEDDLSKEEIFSLFQIAVWAVLFIPMAFTGMVVECFKEDSKAGFHKYQFSLPLSSAKIVGSRYAACLLFAFVSLLGSLLAAFFVSLVSEVFVFGTLISYVFTFCGVMLIYLSLVMLLLYWLGSARADIIQCAPFVVLFLAFLIWFLSKNMNMSEELAEQMLVEMMHVLGENMKKKGWMVFMISLFWMGISYLGSCLCVMRRKGIE